MRSLLLVLPFALMLIVPASALSQASPGGEFAANAQYDQYDDGGSGGGDSTVGDQAAHDALIASGAIQATSEEAQATDTGSVSAAEPPSALDELNAASAEVGNTETQSESANTSDPEKLPDTGGPSPLWLGVPLACIGGFFARRLLFYSS